MISSQAGDRQSSLIPVARWLAECHRDAGASSQMTMFGQFLARTCSPFRYALATRDIESRVDEESLHGVQTTVKGASAPGNNSQPIRRPSLRGSLVSRRDGCLRAKR